ncbi:MAG: DUF2815 family protein [Lachnospiraceae bacterium]|nr:DUF2815 family protein [Lachnospiraceae bacterium]
MIKAKNLIVRGIMMYVHLFKKFSFSKDAEGHYMVTIVISKEDKEQIEAIKKAINAAYQEGVDGIWNGKEPKNFHNPLKDGDDKEDDTGVFTNCYYLTLKSKDAPEVVDQNLQPIIDSKQIYPGCIGNVSVAFIPYKAGGNYGISSLLQNAQLVKAGKRIGGGKKRAVDEFSVIKDEKEAEEIEGGKLPYDTTTE